MSKFPAHKFANTISKSKTVSKPFFNSPTLNEKGFNEIPKEGAPQKQNEYISGIVGQSNNNSKKSHEDIWEKEEEILIKQNTILSKLEEVMSKLSPEVNNQTTEDPAELKKENKRLTEEVDSLKKKLNSLNIYDKKLGSVGFIFKEEAREFVEAMKKLEPNFSTDCDLSSSDSTNLENQISIFFNDVKVAMNKLISVKDESLKENEKQISINEVSINKNSPFDLSNNKDKSSSSQLHSSPNRKLIPKENANTELLIELNMLRRKMLDYEIIQDELSYYKNLSLNYHKKNSNLLHTSSLQNLMATNDTQYTNPYRNSSTDFRSNRSTNNNYSSTYRHNVYNIDNQYRKYY